MPAKRELQETLNGFGQETETQKTPELPQQPGEVESKEKSKVPPSRQGKRHISGYFDPAVLRQVKIICAEEDKTVNEVLAEALNAYFVNLGKPPIA